MGQRRFISIKAKNLSLFVFASSFVAGIFCASVLGRYLYFFSFCLLLTASGLVIYLSLQNQDESIVYKFLDKKDKIFLCVLIIVAFILGVTRFSFVNRAIEKQRNDFLIGQKVRLEGVVLSEPEDRGNKLIFSVKSDRFIYQDKEIDGKDVGVLIFADRFADVRYGDRVIVDGVLKQPQPFDTDAGHQFNYPAYLKKDRILYIMFYPSLNITDRNQGNFLKSWLFSLKQSFLHKIETVMNEPEASLAGGIIWGEKRNLPPELMDNFRKVGLVHIVVLSGYNLTIVADNVIKFLSFLRRRYLQLLFGAVFILIYTLASGGSPAAVRAAIMALVVLLAKSLGRPYDMARALFLACMLMAFHNPFIVSFDPGFALSFAATLSLVILAPRLQTFFNFLTEKFGIREIVSTTIATQIFVMPFLFYFSGLFPVFSLLTNLLVLPIVPLAMFTSFLSSTIAIVSQTLALPLAFFASLILHYFIKVSEFFASIPLSAISVKNFPFWGVILVYFCFVVIFVFTKKFIKTKI